MENIELKKREFFSKNEKNKSCTFPKKIIFHFSQKLFLKISEKNIFGKKEKNRKLFFGNQKNKK